MALSRSAPSHAAPAASSFLEAMAISSAYPGEKSQLFGSAFIGVPCITKRDSVPHHPGPTQQPGALHGVLAEPVADRVHRRLEPLLTRRRGLAEQIELACVALGQSRQPDPQRPHRQPRIPRRQQSQRGLVDLITRRDWLRLFRLPREMSRVRPVRSEEHTSELQSPCNLVCRLLL